VILLIPHVSFMHIAALHPSFSAPPWQDYYSETTMRLPPQDHHETL